MESTRSVDQARLWNGKQARVAVVGAGAFGTALAQCISVGGCRVTLFGRGPDLASHPLCSTGAGGAATAVGKEGGVNANLSFEGMEGPGAPLTDFDLVVLAVPAQALRDVCGWIRGRTGLNSGDGGDRRLRVLSAAKGIERKTLLLPHRILLEGLGSDIDVGALSGPSFAKELHAGLPTALVVATESDDLAARSQHLLHRGFFRVYRSTDIVGVEVGGALKNVIAMVAGAVDGLELGNNARAAVVTRGLQEIAQVGVKLGATPLTFLGLSGLGDLILTCTGDLSRNRQFGLRCARGEDPQAVIAGMGQVIEGVATAESAWQLASRLALDTPILKAAHDVIYEGLRMREAVGALLTRSHKGEFDWIPHP